MTTETREDTTAPAVTVRNARLLRLVADYLEAHPGQHDQSVWGERTACGTRACIAGWAVILSGAAGHPKPDSGGIDWWLRATGGRGSAFAAELLGLSARESDRLFNSYWEPLPGLTVPQALRLLADGASVPEVSA